MSGDKVRIRQETWGRRIREDWKLEKSGRREQAEGRKLEDQEAAMREMSAALEQHRRTKLRRPCRAE